MMAEMMEVHQPRNHNDGIDNDGDSYVDCDDFDCSSHLSCSSSGSSSCAEYGCVGYTPSNACQCNDLCTQYNNCCDDYEAVCGGSGDGGSSGSEICDDGIDNDGDGNVIVMIIIAMEQ